MTGGRDTGVTRVHGRRPVGRKHGHLTVGGERIGGDEAGERLFRCLSRAHQLEPERAVALLAERLRGDRAHAGQRRRNDRTAAERPRLDADAELAALRIQRDDRVRQPSRPRSQASTSAAFSSGGKTG